MRVQQVVPAEHVLHSKTDRPWRGGPGVHHHQSDRHGHLCEQHQVQQFEEAHQLHRYDGRLLMHHHAPQHHAPQPPTDGTVAHSNPQKHQQLLQQSGTHPDTQQPAG